MGEPKETGSEAEVQLGRGGEALGGRRGDLPLLYTPLSQLENTLPNHDNRFPEVT